jgi:hypothetical protein
VTEQEWLVCTDPEPGLEFLKGKASDRQLRLFACACCRCIWHLLYEERSRNAVETVERYVDGLGTYKDLVAAALAAWDAVVETGTREAAISIGDPWELSAHDLPWTPASVAFLAIAEDDATSLPDPLYDMRCAISTAKLAAYIIATEKIDSPFQGDFVRDIFGNPFRPVTTYQTCNSGNCLAVAKSIYDSRDFDRMPILADALEESGCDNADVLYHCRQSGTHVRGCWVVDLLLGKK